MKKTSRILSAAIIMGALLATTSCEEDLLNNDPFGPEDDVPGVIEDFTATLSYTAGADSKSAFDADSKRVVSNNDTGADLVLCWQSSFGDVITQPSGSLIKELYDYNNINYANPGTCTIQNLGKVNINNYADKITLSEMSPKSGSIPNIKGSNQVQVESGDVVAFKTSQGTVGVAQVSSISKWSRNMTLKGYVYYSNSGY